MPQKKKKKNGGRPNKSNTRISASASKERSRSSDASKPKGTNPKQTNDGRTPSNNTNDNDTNRGNQTLYQRYKTATERFFGYISKTCPSELMGDRRTTDTLLTSVDWMFDTGQTIEQSVLRNLKIAIRFRSIVYNLEFDGGDATHIYFLDVLKYCWSVLTSLPQTTTTTTNHSGETNNNAGGPSSTSSKPNQTNRFDAFLMEDDDDEEVEAEMFPSNPVPRPSQHPGREPFSLNDFLNSDYHSDCAIFLAELDYLMYGISKAYHDMKIRMSDYKEHKINRSSMVKGLIQCSVSANFVLQQVQQLEMNFIAQHEHLTTPYRVLSVIVLPKITEYLEAIVRKHGSADCTAKDISLYLGDCMEWWFRGPKDRFNKRDMVLEFCEKWQIDEPGTLEFRNQFNGMYIRMVCEVPIMDEAHPSNLKKLQKNYPTQLPESHKWLKGLTKFMCGDRAIHHTLRLLQHFRVLITSLPKNGAIDPKRNLFGTDPWIPGTSDKIRDMDELLMCDILPNWVGMVRHGAVGRDEMPRENELCPFIVLIRKYVQEATEPVSWSIAFAVHAMLTAIMAVDQEYYSIESAGKNSFNLYFWQVEDATKLTSESFGGNKESSATTQNKYHACWFNNVECVMFLRNLGLSTYGDRALWNPLCGGTILTYLNYYGNLENGCNMIDCYRQLRITLHLFNALLENGLLRKGQIPLLDFLLNEFRNSKAVWEGRTLPKRGEFVSRFLLCLGCTIETAQMISNQSKGVIHGTEVENFEMRVKVRKTAVYLQASDISKSFRRICNRDYHDVDVYGLHCEENLKRFNEDNLRLYSNVTDTMGAIGEDGSMMQLNFPSCGAYLEHFVNILGRVMNWDTILESGKKNSNESKHRQRFLYLFAHFLLGALDFADNPRNHMHMNKRLGATSSQFMTKYFCSIIPPKLLWFTDFNKFIGDKSSEDESSEDESSEDKSSEDKSSEETLPPEDFGGEEQL